MQQPSPMPQNLPDIDRLNAIRYCLELRQSQTSTSEKGDDEPIADQSALRQLTAATASHESAVFYAPSLFRSVLHVAPETRLPRRIEIGKAGRRDRLSITPAERFEQSLFNAIGIRVAPKSRKGNPRGAGIRSNERNGWRRLWQCLHRQSGRHHEASSSTW